MEDKKILEAKIICPNCKHPITVRSYYNTITKKFDKSKGILPSFEFKDFASLFDSILVKK